MKKINLSVYRIKWSIIAIIFVFGLMFLVIQSTLILITIGIALLIYNFMLASIHDILNEYNTIKNKKKFVIECYIEALIILTSSLWKIYLSVFIWSGWNDTLADKWMSDMTLTIAQVGIICTGSLIFLVVVRIFYGIHKIIIKRIINLNKDLFIKCIILSYDILCLLTTVILFLKNSIIINLLIGIILIIYETFRVMMRIILSKLLTIES